MESYSGAVAALFFFYCYSETSSPFSLNNLISLWMVKLAAVTVWVPVKNIVTFFSSL